MLTRASAHPIFVPDIASLFVSLSLSLCRCSVCNRQTTVACASAGVEVSVVCGISKTEKVLVLYREGGRERERERERQREREREKERERVGI
jgi:hypothetical protein